jgi:hypothetical protein
MSTDRPDDEKTLPMTVANPAFLVDRLGEDCAPSQFVRELTQNSIESGATEVVWDVDWVLHTLEGLYKLSIVDDGDGMTGEQMIRFINQLSSSIHDQSLEGNFGVGAKIAAAPRNRAGLIYQSWVDGTGEMVHLWRDDQRGVYGLRQFETDGTYSHVGRLSDDVKPDLIGKHGTKVILLGDSEQQNTMLPPADAASPTKWLARYLNTRYFRFPDSVRIRVREGWEHDDPTRNKLRTVDGQGRFLAEHSVASGEQRLEGATAHWWILTDDEKRTSSYGGAYAASGHVAALWRDELYELATSRAGITRLQTFGVTFGTNRIVVYIEPDATMDVGSNTARTQLLIGSEPLPWSHWAVEFRENMPKPIRDLMDEISSGVAASDHRDAIKERLRQIRDLLKLSRYLPTPEGKSNVQDITTLGGRDRTSDQKRSAKPSRSGTKGGKAGSIYAVFIDPDGPAAEEVAADPYPDTKWITKDDGTREAGQIEDRAAEFFLDQNLLLINADFRVFTDMVDRWQTVYAGVPGAHTTVQDVVRDWFEQALVEAVLGVQALRGGREWSRDELAAAHSKEALSAAVMPRFNTDAAIRRSLANRFGALGGRIAA